MLIRSGSGGVCGAEADRAAPGTWPGLPGGAAAPSSGLFKDEFSKVSCFRSKDHVAMPAFLSLGGQIP